MSLTSAQSRSSAIYITLPWRSSMPIPNGSVDIIDMTQLCDMYTGLAGVFVVAADTASGSDALSSLSAVIRITDTITALDAQQQYALLTILDAASALDIPNISVICTAIDIGNAVDTHTVPYIYLSIADTILGTDTVFNTFLIKVADTIAAADLPNIRVLIPLTDSAYASDIGALSALITALDTIAGVDSIKIVGTGYARVMCITFTGHTYPYTTFEMKYPKITAIMLC
jgi:hypothetical protein